MLTLAATIAVVWVAASPLNAAQTQQSQKPASPPQRVASFLKFHLSRDNGLTVKNLEARKVWLTPTLYRALKREIERQTAFQAKHPDEVPFINGDVFTDSQEAPTSYRVASAKGHDVQVQYKFGPSVRHVRYRMLLSPAKAKQEWLIEDVIADGRSLMKTLQRPDYLKD